MSYVCLCMCVREKEERHKIDKRQRIRKKIYITKEMNQLVTKWEEGAFYSHPLSSLTTKAYES